MYVYFIILEEHATYFHKWLFLHVHIRLVCPSKSKRKDWKSEVFQITMKKNHVPQIVLTGTTNPCFIA